MLLLTSLSLVIWLSKLAQDNGKSQKATGGNQQNGIRNLSTGHLFHIFHYSHQHYYGIFNPSWGQFSKNRWVAVKGINRKNCCPLKGPPNATHRREEDYIRVESALEWREEHYYHFSFGRGGITFKDLWGCQVLVCGWNTKHLMAITFFFWRLKLWAHLGFNSTFCPKLK